MSSYIPTEPGYYKARRKIGGAKWEIVKVMQEVDASLKPVKLVVFEYGCIPSWPLDNFEFSGTKYTV